MTEQPSQADLATAFPGFNPFNSTDPHIRFLIASIVTASVLLTEIDIEKAFKDGDATAVARYDELISALILAANALRVETAKRMDDSE